MIHPYATEAYARSLSHWGEAVHVPEWGCHVIALDTPGAPDTRGALDTGGALDTRGGKDAAGTYPLAVMAPDSDLAGGLERLRRLGLVSVTLVLDEFHRPPLEVLREHFDVVNPFKTHHIRRNSASFAYGKHHRYEVRRASKQVSVRQFELGNYLPEWSSLYADLIRRHELGGVHEFASSHFDALSRLQGTTSIGAWLDGRLVSAHIWVSDGQYVHSHLAASNGEGYAAGAAYAVYDASVRHFAGAELLNFGGGAGPSDDPRDGLSRFKKGFANESAPAYICGAILDEGQYHELVRRRGVPPDTLFFPAYRARTG
jgi:hypothetical protein